MENSNPDFRKKRKRKRNKKFIGYPHKLYKKLYCATTVNSVLMKTSVMCKTRLPNRNV